MSTPGQKRNSRNQTSAAPPADAQAKRVRRDPSEYKITILGYPPTSEKTTNEKTSGGDTLRSNAHSDTAMTAEKMDTSDSRAALDADEAREIKLAEEFWDDLNTRDRAALLIKYPDSKDSINDFFDEPKPKGFTTDEIDPEIIAGLSLE